MLALGLTLGCESSGPEFADGETRIVAGRLESDDVSQTDFFAVTQTGIVAIELTSLLIVDGTTGEPIAEPNFAVSIGQPNPDDQSVCQVTFSQLLDETEAFSVYYPEGLFCVVGFRNPDGPTDTEVDYVLTLTGSFS